VDKAFPRFSAVFWAAIAGLLVTDGLAWAPDVRDRRPTTVRHDALIPLTREIVGRRGHVDPDTVTSFLAAGYQPEQVMEVLLGVALKTISNYLDHMSPTTIDPAFAAWR